MPTVYNSFVSVNPKKKKKLEANMRSFREAVVHAGPAELLQLVSA